MLLLFFIFTPTAQLVVCIARFNHRKGVVRCEGVVAAFMVVLSLLYLSVFRWLIIVL